MRAFRSEWVQLSRRGSLLGFGGAKIGVTLLFTFMAFVSVGATDVGLEEAGAEPFVTQAMLSQPDGSLFAVTRW